MPLVPDIEEVTVDNGEHDIRGLMDQVEAWAKRRPDSISVLGDRVRGRRVTMIRWLGKQIRLEPWRSKV